MVAAVPRATRGFFCENQPLGIVTFGFFCQVFIAPVDFTPRFDNKVKKEVRVAIVRQELRSRNVDNENRTKVVDDEGRVAIITGEVREEKLDKELRTAKIEEEARSVTIKESGSVTTNAPD